MAADIWFNQELHKKLKRLIEIARAGEKLRESLAHDTFGKDAR